MRYKTWIIFVILFTTACAPVLQRDDNVSSDVKTDLQENRGKATTCYIAAVGAILPIEVESAIPYHREQFLALNNGRSWGDFNHDCKDTRAEILEKTSLIPPVLSKDKCTVKLGLWYDPYTDAMFEEAHNLDIDHIVPLKEAFESGAYAWDSEKRGKFENDYVISKDLIPVWNSANRSKGDKDIADWLPPNKSYQCEYVKRWVYIKSYWNLSVDQRECSAIQNVLQKCQ